MQFFLGLLILTTAALHRREPEQAQLVRSPGTSFSKREPEARIRRATDDDNGWSTGRTSFV